MKQRDQVIDSTRPAFDYELRIEISVCLQSVDQSQVAKPRFAPFREQLDERPNQRIEDVARGGRARSFIEAIEELATPFHQRGHAPLEQGLEYRLLAPEVIVERSRR